MISEPGTPASHNGGNPPATTAAATPRAQVVNGCGSNSGCLNDAVPHSCVGRAKFANSTTQGMQKNYVSIADSLPPDHPLGRLVESTMADFHANYQAIHLQRQRDIIASLSSSAADSGSVDGLNADSAFNLFN